MDLESAARELYALLPGEFTAARNARAKEAAQDGHKELARQIKALAKPSAAAWLVNLLSRQRSADIAGIVELGHAMSEAQEQLDPQQLRRLGDQRRELLAAVAAEGRKLADELGQKVSAAAVTEAEQTLHAAMADAAAAAAVTSGLLTESLSSNGIDPVELDGRVALPGAGAPPDAGAEPAPPRQPKRSSRDELAERRAARAKRAAKQEAEDAERRRRQAQAALDKAEQRKEDAEASEQKVLDKLDQLQSRRDELVGELAELKRRIEDLEREVASTDRKMEAAEEDLVSAAKTADRTRKAAAAARRELAEQE